MVELLCLGSSIPVPVIFPNGSKPEGPNPLRSTFLNPGPGMIPFPIPGWNGDMDGGLRRGKVGESPGVRGEGRPRPSQLSFMFRKIIGS